MRLLFLSNFYPPADRGGWEQWCQEIADEFRHRGHQVVILTSRFGLEKAPTSERDVYRALYLESDLYHYRLSDLVLSILWRDPSNRRALSRIVQRFQPEVVLIWGMWQLNPQLAVWAEALCPGRVGYYFCGYWPLEPSVHAAFWQRPERKPWLNLLKRPLARAVKAILALQRPGSPRFQHVACVSSAVLEILRGRGLDLAGAQVLYGGIKVEQFYRSLADAPLREPGGPLRLLYAGSIAPQKGVDTAIHAVAELAQQFAPPVFHLTIVGAGHPSFERPLHRFVRERSLEPYVTFLGWTIRDEVRQLFHGSDVLLFPSTYEEPLARTMMEGMAAGLVVVGTTTGGSKEILEHGHNSLTFPAGNAQELAHQIRLLLVDPALERGLAVAGQETALQRLNFPRMADQLESFCASIARKART